MAQIQSKNLATGAVGKLLNNVYLLARNAASSADVNIVKVNASDRIEFASMPQSSATPATGNDLVNKTYADAITGTGANTTLSNLGTTSINSDLLPSASGTRSFGSATLLWLTAFISTLKDSSSVISVDVANRVLKNSSGSTVIDFSGTNPQTSVTPSSGNDIANKTYVDSVASNQKTWNSESKTLSGTDITNQYVDLAQVAITGSIDLYFSGIWQRPTTDYTINYTGGTGGKTRVSFAGDLATGGASALVSTDVIYFKYQY